MLATKVSVIVLDEMPWLAEQDPLFEGAPQTACTDGDLPWPDTAAVGGWWNRQLDPEIDIVGADRAPVAGHILFAGSVKWLGTPFDGPDLTALTRSTAQLPGFDTGRSGTLVVSLSGVTPEVTGAVDAVWGPGDVVEAWR